MKGAPVVRLLAGSENTYPNVLRLECNSCALRRFAEGDSPRELTAVATEYGLNVRFTAGTLPLPFETRFGVAGVTVATCTAKIPVSCGCDPSTPKVAPPFD